MEAFVHQFISGLATGGIYASIALALVMIYNATNHINFAQGEMAMFSTYIAWTLMQNGASYWVAFVATVVIAFCIGIAIERIVIRPIKNARPLSVIVVFIGILVIFNSLAGWLFTYTVRSFPSPFPSSQPFGSDLISFHELGAMLITAIVVAFVYLFFRYTRLGLAMRASAQNPISSRLVGILVGWMLALGWGLASAIGAIAGMLVAPIVFLDPNMMAGVLVYAFAAALLGGINNPWGAVAGGFVIGVFENLVGAYLIGTELKLTIALIVIVGTLIIKPAGLFGKVIVSRV